MLVKEHFHGVTEMLNQQDLVGDSEATGEEDSD